MKAFVAKRNPVLALFICTAVGIGLLASHNEDGQSVRQSAKHSANEARSRQKTNNIWSLSDRLESHANDSYAPEAHRYGFQLLEEGNVTEALSILADGCETGDTTACAILGEQEAARGEIAQAEKVLLKACSAAQLPACKSILDNDRMSENGRRMAFEKLSDSCRVNDDAAACVHLADSRWAVETGGRQVRTFLALACSRGDDQSCRRLKGG